MPLEGGVQGSELRLQAVGSQNENRWPASHHDLTVSRQMPSNYWRNFAVRATMGAAKHGLT